MTARHDDHEVFRRRMLAARKRTLLHFMHALERQALQMAIRARRRTTRGRGREQAAPFNPVTQLKRQIMPLMAQLAELAAGGALPPPQQPKKSKRRPKRLKAERPSSDGAAAAEAAPLRIDDETPAIV